MKRILPFLLILAIMAMMALSACASGDTPSAQSGASGEAASLLVSSGNTSKVYTQADLETLASTQAVFKDVAYKGVTVSTLIQDAGFDLAKVKAIKAVASDGFTVNYDTSQVFVDDVIVAYALANGDLTADDGSFRMVLPGAEGKMNVRMLKELQVIQ